MYDQHYGFSSKPFALTPDFRFFYKSQPHKRAMAYLEYGLEQAEGFIVITGPVGTGKTTLIEGLLSGLDASRLLAVHLVSTHLSGDELLQLICQHLKLSVSEQASKSQLLHAMERQLRQLQAQGKRVILVIDEAQNLSTETLEELRMLSNFRLGHQPMLQSFLLGQEELRDNLQQPGLEQFRQRITAACHLNALTLEETRGYIHHRLQQVGWKGTPGIDPETFELIQQSSQGIPRRINQICDRLLLACYLEEQARIDPELTKAVLDELQKEMGSCQTNVSGAKTPQAVAQTATSALSDDSAVIFRQHLEQLVHYLDQQINKRLEKLEQLDTQLCQRTSSKPAPINKATTRSKAKSTEAATES